MRPLKQVVCVQELGNPDLPVGRRGRFAEQLQISVGRVSRAIPVLADMPGRWPS
jgi:hypothetical protein